MSDIEMNEDTKPKVEENVGQWQKNLTYWFADGSIVLRVCLGTVFVLKKTEIFLG
jgi:hypothetical protein